MPKVELHVHLEGSIRPETVLKLAQRHGITLPAATAEGLRDWYRFRDFPHFVEVYVAVSKCIKTPDDIELIAREFLQGQAEQNVLHSEVTYTASTIEKHNGIAWPDQHAALKRAIEYGERELGVSMALILDIVRGDPAERGCQVADWAIAAHGDGVCALGIAGIEGAVPADTYADAFRAAHEAGLPVIPHAGETKGAQSVREALDKTGCVRIGHGVRCLEDPGVVRALRDRQIPLEVCPSSNVCLGVFPTLAEHTLPRLLDEGLYVTINSDDPPMFDTTVSNEFHRCAETFEFDENILWTLCLNAARASLLPEEKKRELVERLRNGFNANTL
ncbi:adenosine deaminase [Fimbriimonas ginsengisoli]|uniref:Adenosine deaminase n=1 Tax=Fimbriimonas ginsengisoli Gsoil 348 TaxID=661478 RepID=A0A068NSX1_FIMGI|nr:adenosine deaminase [Fimbriimonas ginsengisoli]AIE84719.1 adenosine deaminase [Fimbriimonas ginsengisoli Gsoil 348]